MPDLWALHISPAVARFIYMLPRGRATELRDALAVLRTNPKPAGARPLVIEELPDVFEVKIGLYRIEYQMVTQDHILCILLVE